MAAFVVSCQDEDIHGLLSSLHGICFRRLCTRLGGSFEGLAAAARHGRRQGILTNGWAKKLERLDTAVAFTRHANQPRLQALLADFEAHLAKGKHAAPATPAASQAKEKDDLPLQETTLSKTALTSLASLAEPWVIKETTAEEEEEHRQRKRQKETMEANPKQSITTGGKTAAPEEDQERKKSKGTAAAPAAPAATAPAAPAADAEKAKAAGRINDRIATIEFKLMTELVSSKQHAKYLKEVQFLKSQLAKAGLGGGGLFGST